jgi:hypothetical protein
MIKVENVYCSVQTNLLHELRFVFKGVQLSRNYTAYFFHHYWLAHYTRIGSSYSYVLILFRGS